MVNIPIAPKKYHTFNENEAPSHKEIKNRITLATTNENEEINGTNESIRKNFMVKPLKRTGSTVNNVNNKCSIIISDWVIKLIINKQGQ